MKAHAINSLNNFICAWYMDDHNLLDRIHTFGRSDNFKIKGMIHNNGEFVTDTSIKNSIDSELQRNPALFIEYANKIKDCLKLYGDIYSYSVSLSPLTIIEPVNIQMYPPNGGYFKTHCERSSKEIPFCFRHLVFMTYLNDVDEGGETEFIYQKLKIKPEKGLTVIWPADFTFMHRGLPTKENKSIVTGWISYA